MTDPFVIFADWLALAFRHEPNDANAMSLATVGADGKPSVRMVLLKEQDGKGFVFYSHATSHKGQDLAKNPHVALCFHWKSLLRQVRIEGIAEQVPAAQADAYFHSRPRFAQLGALASRQSEVMADRGAFEAEIQALHAQYDGQEIPRPEHWVGWRVVPSRLEFWQQMPYRLHERQLFTRSETGWISERLMP